MIEIHGASDDLVCVSIDGNVFDEYSKGEEILIGTLERGVIVELAYGDRGGAVWRGSVRQVEEGRPVPWPVSITNAAPNGHPDPRTYSVAVIIDAPSETPISVLP